MRNQGKGSCGRCGQGGRVRSQMGKWLWGQGAAQNTGEQPVLQAEGLLISIKLLGGRAGEDPASWYIFTKHLFCARPCLECWFPGTFALKIRISGAAKSIEKLFSKGDAWLANKWMATSSRALQSRQRGWNARDIAQLWTGNSLKIKNTKSQKSG